MIHLLEPDWVHPALYDLEVEFLDACRSGNLTPRQMLQRFGRLPRMAGGSVPGGGYEVNWTGVALTGATAKTIVGLATGANTPVNINELSVSGDATTGNILIALVYGTNATNPPGTNSSSFTPLQDRGPTQTFVATSATNWTAEPTVLTVLKYWRMPWPAGPFVIQSPLGREVNSVPTSSTSGKFVGIRVTSSVAVTNCDGYCSVEE